MLHLPLAKEVLDRTADLRGDESALDSLAQSGVFYFFIEGKWLVDDQGLVELTSAESQKYLDASERYFLGRDLDGIGHFLIHHAGERTVEHEGLRLENLRTKVADFSPLHIDVAMHGQGLANWHSHHPFCSRCGKITQPITGGAVRSCEDGHQHHPRTDPAIITLIKDRDDRILLGHQASWPEGRFSTFAGFVEPGESFEAALHREVAEESGVKISEFQYLGSQPWPFPSSVMIAFEAVTDDPTSARPDGEEIVEIEWFTRESLLEATRSGRILLPPPISVARAMIDRWYGEKSNEPLVAEDLWRS
jgi:NAD+ diphosphatase